MPNMEEEVRRVYQHAWQQKLDEIRSRPNSAPVIPYEAHTAGMVAIINWVVETGVDQHKLADVLIDIEEGRRPPLDDNTRAEGDSAGAIEDGDISS